MEGEAPVEATAGVDGKRELGRAAGGGAREACGTSSSREREGAGRGGRTARHGERGRPAMGGGSGEIRQGKLASGGRRKEEEEEMLAAAAWRKKGRKKKKKKRERGLKR